MGGRVERVSGSTPLHHPPRLHTICAITLCTCVHLCAHAHRCASTAHLRSNHPLPSTATRRWNTYYIPARLNANTDPPPSPEFDQNSSEEENSRGKTRRTNRPVGNFRCREFVPLYSRPRRGWAVKPWPSNFVSKGLHSHKRRKEGEEEEDEGRGDRKKLRVDATMAFCQTNTTLWKTIPREPLTQRPRLFILPPPTNRLPPRPDVPVASDMHNFLSLRLLVSPSFFLFFFFSFPIIVHLGQPFRRQFRLFFEDVHHFSGRVKSHSYPPLSLRG